MRELQRFGQDESGNMVDTIVTMGMVIVIMGPALVVLSNKLSDLFKRIILYLARIP